MLFEKLQAATDLKPLVVDLDGALVRSDFFLESAIAEIGRHPLRVFGLLSAMRGGKAPLDGGRADETEIETDHLPYDPTVMSLIQERRAAGGQVYLASAGTERYVRSVADHLGLFDGCFAGQGHGNPSSEAMSRRLVQAFGERGFDYVGSKRSDPAVWPAANERIAVHASPALRSSLLSLDPAARFLDTPSGAMHEWIRLLRIHQWAKNALLFVPLVTAQRFDLSALTAEIRAFIAFSLVASAMYVLNDLIDVDADRKHPSKKRRPLAAGTIPVGAAFVAIPVLLTVGFSGAVTLSSGFAAVLLGYLLLTTLYTFVIKRKMFADVLALALLYTVRVIAGAVAISVPISEWLLGFSMFIFTALALMKRYVELATRLDKDLSDPTNRNYRKSDLDIVAALAAAAGFNAVTVFALYISSDAVRPLYRHPEALWFVCIVLMYWLGRALLMAHRRLLLDDPIVFALRDWNSYAALGLIALVLIGAR